MHHHQVENRRCMRKRNAALSLFCTLLTSSRICLNSSPTSTSSSLSTSVLLVGDNKGSESSPESVSVEESTTITRRVRRREVILVKSMTSLSHEVSCETEIEWWGVEGGGGGDARMEFQRGLETPLGLETRTFPVLESTMALRSKHFSRIGVRSS